VNRTDPDIEHPGAHVPAFAWPLRVYYEDTDSMGVVYYANYLKFFERARTEWLRTAGFELTGLAERYQVAFVVRSLAVNYLKPARLNDSLHVTVELAKVGAAHIELAQRVLRSEEPLVTAGVKLACVGTRTLRPIRIPQPIMTRIRTTT
jgi:acyl-CoA thioester hydrolase